MGSLLATPHDACPCWRCSPSPPHLLRPVELRKLSRHGQPPPLQPCRQTSPCSQTRPPQPRLPLSSTARSSCMAMRPGTQVAVSPGMPPQPPPAAGLPAPSRQRLPTLPRCRHPLSRWFAAPRMASIAAPSTASCATVRSALLAAAAAARGTAWPTLSGMAAGAASRMPRSPSMCWPQVSAVCIVKWRLCMQVADASSQHALRPSPCAGSCPCCIPLPVQPPPLACRCMAAGQPLGNWISAQDGSGAAAGPHDTRHRCAARSLR